MTRRLLGPIGSPIIFFLVGALVFAGLGWVTHSALRVEQAQREAAARAELGNNLRVALWQLDSRMLPALGVEDNRPYYHYAPPDPAATPLLIANLPDWMKLHFQLDADHGWSSPLCLDRSTSDKVRIAWADIEPRNLSDDRTAVLRKLQMTCPVRDTHEQFAATERSIPADSLSLAAPLVSGDVQLSWEPNPAPIPPSESLPKPAPSNALEPISNSVKNYDPAGEVVRLFGWEICLRNDNNGGNSARQDLQVVTQNAQKKVAEAGQPQGGQRGSPQQQMRGSGRLNQKDVDNEQQVATWMNRAGLIDRAMREAKLAAEFQMPKGQANNYGQNFLPDLRNSGNTVNPNPGNRIEGQPTGTFSPGLGGFPPGPPAPGGVNPPPGAATGGGFPSRDVKSTPTKPAIEVGRLKPDAATERDKLHMLLNGERLLLTYELSTLFTQPNPAQLRRALAELASGRFRESAENLKPADAPTAPATTPPGKTPPGEDQPPVVPATIPIIEQPTAIHLGSMRPQWITSPDGTDTLVLVRAARVDGKTVYQGVVVDWAKLEATLKEEVKGLFPEAKLVPVKDTTAVYPDRAMTALPVQLDPGPEPELPSAGWTPLRLGLVLSWAAAIIAFAAVGFAGWSLIDLAERRIRFVSAVTHELRTPLTSLRLYLDLLVSGMIQDEEKRQEYLGTLAMESDRLHRLIDNVLDFAKLEKRKKNGDIKAVSVDELVDQLRQTWTDRVALDGKALVVNSTLPVERMVSTDAAMIQQIVGNLIDNVRKYTRDAADKRIWVLAKPGVSDSVVIEVEDRGPGVPASERKSIFKPFRRGDQADSRAGGAGLGLALAKSWAEVLGARLAYRPADGGTGACFRLELPGK